MKNFIKTYGHLTGALLALVVCIFFGAVQHADAYANGDNGVSEENLVAIETSGPQVPGEEVKNPVSSGLEDFGHSTGKHLAENETEKEETSELEESASIEEGESVVEKEMPTITSKAAPVETYEITIKPVPADMSDYATANDYAIACGYAYTQDKTDTIYDAFTAEDIEYICRMVETETYQSPFISKVYTAEVALARYYREGGTVSLKGIVTAPSQFVYTRTNISYDTVWAVEYAYQYMTEAQNAYYFKRGGGGSSWYGYGLLFEDSVGHHFYGDPVDSTVEEVAVTETEEV